MQNLGLDKVADAVMYVLKEVFELEREYMICEPDEWRGKVMLECVMRNENFGKGQNQMPTRPKKLKQWSEFILIYPSETLNDPIFIVCKNFL